MNGKKTHSLSAFCNRLTALHASAQDLEGEKAHFQYEENKKIKIIAISHHFK